MFPLSMTESRSIPFHLFVRLALAIILVLGLVVFLAAARLTRASQAPVLTIRTVDTIPPVSLPAPPPPLEREQAPPSAPVTDLPKLEIEFDSVAPPIQASPHNKIELRLDAADFAPQSEKPREHMTFAASDLDNQPRLISRPTVSFPKAQQARGINEGRVTLEVLIRSSGKVTVQRVIESSHPDFTRMARTFATGSRFTPPKKDGRPVTALFKWPLILRP